MIDIAHAKQEFEKYLDEYDREDEQIYLKIEHTYGVMKYAGEIAGRMECGHGVACFCAVQEGLHLAILHCSLFHV